MGWIIFGGVLIVTAFAYAVLKVLVLFARVILMVGVGLLRTLGSLLR